ncbi:MAG TPA: Gfo/Idh/MocA family oxidoreductase [Vicinamibacterales bacterium]|nr:Gfo/Idh/MocA family oxidoreductase [Vicinamibacterales bacterium]
MAPINVALIGYAFMGRAHSNAYRQLGPFFSPRRPPRMKVICGRTSADVEKARETLGWEESATDWRDVIKRDDIDLVDVCTPGDSHAEIAIAAARAGKHVLCEKPLANSLKDAERMLDAVEKAGVAHMICHNYRRIPAVMLAKQLITEGAIGEIRHYRGTYLQDWMSDPAAPFNWRLDRTKAGSGALGDIASHSIDLARFLVGEITEVSADLKTFVKSRHQKIAEVTEPKVKGQSRRRAATQMIDVTVDDAAMALVHFTSGAIGTIEATRMANGRKNYNRFEINGQLGSVAFDLERMNELEVYFDNDLPHLRGFRTIMVTEPGHPYASHWWPPGHVIGYEHTFVHTIADLLDAITDGVVPTPSFADGVENQRILTAIETAAKTRRWTRV